MYWAKSNPEESIRAHTENLLEKYNDFIEFYGDKYSNLIMQALKDACIHHDLGKMNIMFQNKIRRIKNNTNKIEIPHGYLSVGFVDTKYYKEKYGTDLMRIIITAIAKHHSRDFSLEDNKDYIKEEITNLEETAKKFEYKEFPNGFDKLNKNAINYIYKDELNNIDEKDKTNYILIKGLLNKIDYAASGYYDIEYKNDFLISAMDTMVKEVWRKKNKNADYNELQNYMKENQEENIIAIAETGYGKTEAGLLWIGDNKGFFTLPLRSAINSIYDRISRRILKNINLDERLALLHSDSLNELFSRNDSEKEENLGFEELEILDYDDRARQKSLPLTVSTIDQIFKFVYKYRSFEQELATLSYSKVVIDEIQMYSPDLLAYLVLGLDMITKVGGKFSIITATLPPFILNLLDERDIKYKMPDKPYFKEGKIRHCLKLKQEEINASFIKEKYKDNKVLVIVNTVRKAQELYNELSEDIEEEKLNVFHGGFIKRDRKKVEKEIMEFGDLDNKVSGIWICTQVAEASLDIDFDILITELSDINGLFQRMGRCYRDREYNLKEDETNIYVFDGGDNICSGIGFVNDEDIFYMSRDKLREEFSKRNSWRMTEKDKIDMINNLYTIENLKDKEYMKKIKEAITYVEETFTYSLSKNEVTRMFRSINNIDIIPRKIYEDHKIEIEKCMEKIREKNISRDKDEERKIQRLEKSKARIFISDLTVNIPFYFSNHDNTEFVRITDYESINIYTCEYDDKFGVKHIKDIIKKEYVEESDNTF